MNKVLLLLTSLVCYICVTNAQISPQNNTGQSSADYSDGKQDPIYIFCTTKGNSIGTLEATAPNKESSTFEWLKLSSANNFVSYRTDANTDKSTLYNLENGCYRVNISNNTTNTTHTAWVFNSWYESKAEIIDCQCEYTAMEASFSEATPSYIDLSNGTEKHFNKDVHVKWEAEGVVVNRNTSAYIYNPPAKNTNYTFTVYDQFGCSSSSEVMYESIVPEASFSVDPASGEAPLEVQFSNTSKNADKFEYFLYRSTENLTKEYLEQGEVLDSIMTNLYTNNPTFIYSESGSYKVKLIAGKTSDNLYCIDEFILENNIEVDTSYIDAPNFFTPNGDGFNDEFLIKFTSMKSFTIKIFNRWGKLVFEKSNNNVGTFNQYGSEFSWDGRIGGSYASPGVYYYVVEGTGRDGKRRAENGFFHLFREK